MNKDLKFLVDVKLLILVELKEVFVFLVGWLVMEYCGK